MPGAVTEFVLHGADGGVARVGGHSMDTVLLPGQTFEFRCASGGGYGDPLDRDPAAVALDVKHGRITEDEAKAIYGVVLTNHSTPASGGTWPASTSVPDTAATAAARQALLAERLRLARPAGRPVGAERRPPPDAQVFPLYPGVEQRGNLAVSARTGAVLAEAPDHFTDGCPVLEERFEFASGSAVVYQCYLDPASGHLLAVDVLPEGSPRAFSTLPHRWTSVR